MADRGSWGLGVSQWSVIKYVIVAGLVGLAILLWQGGRGGRDWLQPVHPADGEAVAVSGGGEADLAALERQMSRSLAEILSRIDGAGQVYVQVTLSAGPRTLYERDQQSSLRVTEEQDAQGGTRSVTEETASDSVVMGRSTGGDRPVASQVTAVEVRGVLVVAQGASQPAVQARLAAAVAALLDVSPHRIQVVPGR